MKTAIYTLLPFVADIAFAAGDHCALNLRNLDRQLNGDFDATVPLEAGVQRRYDGYQLLHVHPSTIDHFNVLRLLEQGMENMPP